MSVLSGVDEGMASSFVLLIPTRNAGAGWSAVLDSVAAQSCAPARYGLFDSGSMDETAERARAAGWAVRVIDPATFNHGGTRQHMVAAWGDSPLVVWMTQDALLADADALCALLRAFEDPAVGAAYGRQLPYPHTGAVGAHARLFNYPPTAHVCDLRDAERMGIKAAFLSNSFAAYRVEALRAVGGFPTDVILGEDTIVAAKMLLAGRKVAYQADAQVFHSHDYTHLQEFRRYFDIGVMHARARWMLDAFGSPEGEGGRFVRSELAYLLRRAPWLIPSALLRTVLKYLGYRLGRLEHALPVSWKRRLSMHTGFWRSS